MPTGSVVRFDRRRGYGFVQPDDGGEDVFVHQNNIIMEGFRFLQVGEKVTYELEVGEKGMKAVSVSLLEPRAPRADQGDDGLGGFGGDDRDRGDQGDRPRYPRSERAPFSGGGAPHAPRAPRGGDDRGDKAARKLERVISLLVAKGIIAPGEVDGVEGLAKAAENA